MSTVEAIENAVQKLTPADLAGTDAYVHIHSFHQILVVAGAVGIPKLPELFE